MKISFVRKVSHFRIPAISLAFGIVLILFGLFPPISAQDSTGQAAENENSTDKLAYVSDDNHLMLYDPPDRTEITLLDNVERFAIGRDGHVAFTKHDEQDTDLYVFDPSTPTIAPINISQNPAMHYYPLAWSPDGLFLAFVAFIDSRNYTWIYQGGYQAGSDDQSLFVWDGNKVINVMPDNQPDAAEGFSVDWSYDGRLAFTVEYGWSDLDTPSEIYVWDGSTTTNLSQNPEGLDGFGNWSRDGQLMFGSNRDEEGGIYVWDGVSFKNGSPDSDSFVRLAPEMEPTYAIWVDDGLVAFTVYSDSPPSGTKEIVLWNLESESIVKHFPISSEYVLSRLAEGGQVILSYQLASGLPSDYLDVENTEGEILFSTHTGQYAWSADGYLAYCGIDEDRNWILSIWDGEESWVVARINNKPVQWQHGRDIFSCNFG